MAFKHNGTAVITNDRLVRLNSGADGSRPASPTVGTLFYNTTSGAIEVYNGLAWKASVLLPPAGTPALYAWGKNNNAELGDLTTIDRSSPVTVVGGYTDWIGVSVGTDQILALRSNGTAWAWGANTNGMLGTNDDILRSSPTSVVGGQTWIQVSTGRDHSAAIRSDGTLWAWGQNNNGGLGVNDTIVRSSPVSVVGGFTDWTQIDVGGYNTMIGLRANGTAWCWGAGGQGQIGNNAQGNRSSPTSVAGGFNDWIQVTSGRQFHSAVRANGQIWTWGANKYGELGRNTGGNYTSQSSPVSLVGEITDWISVSSGAYHSIGLRANGTAWTWGRNVQGQLATGDFVNRSSPVSVVGGFTDWVQISAGTEHSLGIKSDGKAWAWGWNNRGQLGNTTGLPSNASPISVAGGFTDWIQVSAGGKGYQGRQSAGIRSQPITQTTRPGNQRNRF